MLAVCWSNSVVSKSTLFSGGGSCRCCVGWRRCLAGWLTNTFLKTILYSYSWWLEAGLYAVHKRWYLMYIKKLELCIYTWCERFLSNISNSTCLGLVVVSPRRVSAQVHCTYATIATGSFVVPLVDAVSFGCRGEQGDRSEAVKSYPITSFCRKCRMLKNLDHNYGCGQLERLLRSSELGELSS